MASFSPLFPLEDKQNRRYILNIRTVAGVPANALCFILVLPSDHIFRVTKRCVCRKVCNGQSYN